MRDWGARLLRARYAPRWALGGPSAESHAEVSGLSTLLALAPDAVLLDVARRGVDSRGWSAIRVENALVQRCDTSIRPLSAIARGRVALMSIGALLCVVRYSRASQPSVFQSDTRQKLEAIVRDFADQHRLPGMRPASGGAAR